MSLNVPFYVLMATDTERIHWWVHLNVYTFYLEEENNNIIRGGIGPKLGVVVTFVREETFHVKDGCNKSITVTISIK